MFAAAVLVAVASAVVVGRAEAVAAPSGAVEESDAVAAINEYRAMSGLAVRRPLAAPIVWPGDGSTTSLDRFIVETPDPLPMCGWNSGGGLPVVALMPEATTTASATISGPGGPLQTCTLFDKNVTDTTAKAILAGDNVVTVLPRSPLAAGTYRVRIATDVRVVSRSFTVDPDTVRPTIVGPARLPPLIVTPIVASGPTSVGVPTSMTTATTMVIGPAGGYRSVAPSKLVDTRDGQPGTGPTRGGVIRVQVAGQGSVPTDARAISANFTAVESAEDGYLTEYPCAGRAVGLDGQLHRWFGHGQRSAGSARCCGWRVRVLECRNRSRDRCHRICVAVIARAVHADGSGTRTRHAHRLPVVKRLSAGETLEVQFAGVDTGVPLGQERWRSTSLQSTQMLTRSSPRTGVRRIGRWIRRSIPM